MIARPMLAPEQQMTIEEFLAFTDTRPQEERWELIEGVPVLNPSPIDYHQVVVTNMVSFLTSVKLDSDAPWFPMIGTGTRVPASKHSLPRPDAADIYRWTPLGAQ
jgi:Uma2 family endonuclease